jgi:hypothetical protein
MCHYNYHVSEECYYYSTNCVSVITISRLFEECHYVRETSYRVHLQVYWRLCIFVWTTLPLAFLSPRSTYAWDPHARVVFNLQFICVMPIEASSQGRTSRVRCCCMSPRGASQCGVTGSRQGASPLAVGSMAGRS